MCQQGRPTAKIISNARRQNTRRPISITIRILTKTARFINTYPRLNPIPKQIKTNKSKILKILRNNTISPSPQILQRLRQIPMVQRHHGLYIVFQQRINEIIVVSDTIRINVIGTALREDSTPRQGKSVKIHPYGFEQRDITTPQMVRIASNITTAVIFDENRMLVSETVPDILTFTYFFLNSLLNSCKIVFLRTYH